MAFDAALKAEEVSDESEREDEEEEEVEREMEPELERELKRTTEPDEFVVADSDMESDEVRYQTSIPQTTSIFFDLLFCLYTHCIVSESKVIYNISSEV